MAGNRFKKSIENATENTQDSIIYNQADNIQADTFEKQVDNTVEEQSDIITEKTGADILKKVLDGGKKDRGSNHTIYLSADVGTALEKYAKKSKKSKSTLVDEILREVFRL